MSKNKNRNKENHNQPGNQGMFYAQKLCPICKKLIVGHSGKSIRHANSDLGQRLKAHREECQKEREDKQLDLSIPGPEQEQTETISRVTLRGEVK